MLDLQSLSEPIATNLPEHFSVYWMLVCPFNRSQLRQELFVGCADSKSPHDVMAVLLIVVKMHFEL